MVHRKEQPRKRNQQTDHYLSNAARLKPVLSETLEEIIGLELIEIRSERSEKSEIVHQLTPRILLSVNTSNSALETDQLLGAGRFRVNIWSQKYSSMPRCQH